MEWQILYGHFEEVWEARWIFLILQLVMVLAIIVIGTAIAMINKRTWLEGASFSHPISAKEASFCTGNSHPSG